MLSIKLSKKKFQLLSLHWSKIILEIFCWNFFKSNPQSASSFKSKSLVTFSFWILSSWKFDSVSSSMLSKESSILLSYILSNESSTLSTFILSKESSTLSFKQIAPGVSSMTCHLASLIQHHHQYYQRRLQFFFLLCCQMNLQLSLLSCFLRSLQLFLPSKYI